LLLGGGKRNRMVLDSNNPPLRKRRLGKRIVFVVAVVLVVGLLGAVFGVMFLGSNDGSDETKTVPPDVKITDFHLTSWWSCIGGLVMTSNFNLTLENSGAVNVSGLVLRVKMFHDGSEVPVGNYFDGVDENGTIIMPLGVGEARTVEGLLGSNVGDEAYRSLGLNGTVLVASVVWNGSVLDQRTSG
jgi:hypothetical protein